MTVKIYTRANGLAVTLSEFRQDPGAWFGDRVVAVMDQGKPLGYAIGADEFEHMIKLLDAQKTRTTVPGQFRLTPALKRIISNRGGDVVLEMTPDDLEDFEE